MFDKQIYKERRATLLSNLDEGIYLFLGNEETPMNYKDNHYSFVQDSTFLYYFGINLAGFAAILDTKTGDYTLFGPEITMDHIVWMGQLPSLGEWAEKSGIEQFKNINLLAETWYNSNRSGKKFHYLPPYRSTQSITISQLTGQSPALVNKGYSTSFINAIIQQRSIKGAEEIDQMDEAVNVSKAIHLAAMQHARPGITEYEIYGKMLAAAGKHQSGLSFPAIVTINGQILHNHAKGNTLEAGRLMLCDAGGYSSLRYAGDITRTFPVNSTFSDRQKEIYSVVLISQMSAISACKAGTSYLDIHKLSAKMIIEGMKAVGLMKGNTDDALQAGAHGLFFPHGLGHMLGLDVHDMENLGEDLVGYGNQSQRSDQFGLRSLRLAKKLETGNVITVEPGVYFIPELIQQWKAKGLHKEFIDYSKLESFQDFGGIRIEDDVLITDKGSRILGEPIPKSIIEIESIRTEALENA